MKHERGDMWTIWNSTDHFIFTGNSFVKNNGALVMGRGIARAVRDKFDDIDRIIGREVLRVKDVEGFYGLILGRKLGVFQVKYFWGDNAELALIERSAVLLKAHAEAHPDERYDINFPGIGNGKLAFDVVAPALEVLPDNVHIWTFN